MKLSKDFINLFEKSLIEISIFCGFVKSVSTKIIYNDLEYIIKINFEENKSLYYKSIKDINFLIPEGKNKWRIKKVPKELFFVLDRLINYLSYLEYDK